MLHNPRSIYKNQLYFYALTTNNQKLKLKIAPLATAKQMKYLSINLEKNMTHLNIENNKILMRKLNET